jgi:HPt (histidine-containing phosphotransfer) domain-containing protein
MISHAVGGTSSTFSVARLRTFILIALVTGVAGFTGVMVTSVNSLSKELGPEVQADLEWRAMHGAEEIAKFAELGLAVAAPARVTAAFGTYVRSSDVRAIFAFDTQNELIAHHGEAMPLELVFAAAPGTAVYGPGYVASWSQSELDGNPVGKVAIVISTVRLTDAERLLSRVSMIALVAGVVGAGLGALVIMFFTRQVALRDRQLQVYAHNLEEMVEARTRELDERNRGMRLVLDNVAQGFITTDLRGVMASERSAVVDRWLGEPPPGAKFNAYIEPFGPDLATWFELGLDGLRQGDPIELCLGQIPPRVTVDGKTLDVKYSPILRDDKLERLLIIVSDITEQIILERSEREQRETVALFQRITSDRPGFDEFIEDGAGLVASLATPGDPLVERRTLHTLKGNCASYGLESYAELCHNIETELGGPDAPLSAAQRSSIAAAWHDVTRRLVVLLGETRRNVVEIELAELARVVDKAQRGMSGRELAPILTSWSHELVARRFERLATYATRLARELAKGELSISITADEIRLEATPWSGFWSSMVHAVRNAIDHGVEPPEVRAAAGKPVRPQLAFSAVRERGSVVITISDDGGGIRWDAVRDKARRAGLPADTQADLENALFSDGFSTAQAATEVSGRGVGMSALLDAVLQLGGTIAIESHPGQGTTLRFRFPDRDLGAMVMRKPVTTTRMERLSPP